MRLFLHIRFHANGLIKTYHCGTKCGFPCLLIKQQIRCCTGRRSTGRAARVLRGDDTAQPGTKAHHEERRHVLLHEHHEGGEFGLRCAPESE